MFCPKCKKEYKDGSQKCKECNTKLVVRLPKEKVVKKKVNVVNIDKLKCKKRKKLLMDLFLVITVAEILIYLFGYNFLLKLYGKQDAIVLREVVLRITFLTACVFTSIGLYMGFDIWNEGKVYTLKTKLSAIFVRKIIPIILIAVGVCINYNSITDYILKDYKTSSGVVTEISRSRGYDNIYINGKNYYFNIELFQNVNIGKVYNFTYTKRTNIILNIK